MDSLQRQKLRHALLTGGMPFWRVRRVLLELADHHDDIRAEALAAGSSPAEAVAEARARIGQTAKISEVFLSDGNLRDWPLTLRLADAAVVAGDGFAERAPLVARWSTAFMTSAVGTLAFLFGLHLIIFG